jgi:GT2 family glycosyltransferase
LALAALSSGDIDEAFRFIDRRCRVLPPANTNHYILRAEILMQKAEPSAALESIVAALKTAPEDLQANRRMLAWGKASQRINAARILCKIDDHPPVLVEAAKALRRMGQRAIGSIRVFDSYIRGWAAWTPSQRPELVIYGDAFEQRLTLEADPNHYMTKSGFQRCVAFELPRDPRRPLLKVALQSGAQVFVSQRVASKILQSKIELDEIASAGMPDKKISSGKNTTPLSIVIPVYRDFVATRACLESVARELRDLPNSRLILVDDASPEPDISRFLKGYAKRHHATLLTNVHNLGFVGSVNRALAMIGDGDVVLLNADTVLPGEAFRRLRQTAHAHPEIGTITPLSNNGEFSSFPFPVRANPLPGRKELAALDRAAASANGNLIVDIPSGIGFCLFISAACFKAVGHLNDSFEGGYLEDVDFSLRAREQGFRNVCDPSVFVAHAGTRSFLGDKGNLVMRNLPIINERFPKDQTETRAFLWLDPLRQARGAVERSLTEKAKFDVLIVTGAGLAKPIAQARARRLLQKELRVWLMVVTTDVVSFVNAEEAMPQSLQFKLSEPSERDDCGVYFGGLRFKRIELSDPAAMPATVLTMLQESGRPLDFFAGDCRWMLTRTGKEDAAAKDRVLNWLPQRTSQIIVPCELARGFVQHHLPDRSKIAVEPMGSAKPPARKTKKTKAAGGEKFTCGIISPSRLNDDFHFIKALATNIRRRTKNGSLIILGETFDDLDLMALDDVFVTAAIEAAEIPALCELYKIEKLFLATQKPLFGHPLAEAAATTGLPLAYFDWSFGASVPSQRDLALLPDLVPNVIAARLTDWMVGSR